MLKEKLRDAYDYAQFTATLGLFSVSAVETLQNTAERFQLADFHGRLIDNPMNISIVAAATGVSVGNSFVNDFATRNCLPHVVYSSVLGYLAGTASEHLAASPFITAFVAAASGMALRRNLNLDADTEKPEPRNRYDDFDY